MALMDNTAPDNTPAEGTGAAATPANAEFLETLPEDLRSNETFYGFEDLGGLAKTYLETQGQLSEKEQMIAELQGKVPTIPASPGEYKVELPEGMGSQEFSEFFEFAHETGMTQEQAEKAIKYSVGVQEKLQQKTREAEKQAIGALRTEWGDAFDANIQKAKAAVERFGGDELKAFLEESRLGNNPLLVKMFQKISDAISEDSLLTGNQGRVPQNRPQGIDGKPMLKFQSMEKQ